MLRSRFAIAIILLSVSLAAFAGCRKPAPVVETPPAGPPKAAAPTPSGKLTLYVPCGLTLPLKAVVLEFKKAYPDIEVTDKWDSGVVLVREVLDKGARPDIFMAPGAVEIGALEKEGLMDESTVKEFARFDLAVIVPNGNPSDITTPQDILKAKTIALPSPELTSAGAAAKQALIAEGLWDKIQDRIVEADIASEAHAFVANDKADAGLAFKACPLETAPEKLSKEKVWVGAEFDRKDFDPVRCKVGMLKESRNPDAAKLFIDFMLQKDMLDLMKEKGLPGTDEPAPEAADADAGSSADAEGSALVEIVAYFPGNEEHQFIRDLLTAEEKKHPGLVKTRFVDFNSDDGYTEWTDRGFTCGTIVVNDKYEFEVQKNGQKVPVAFRQSPEHGQWAEEDLGLVVEQELKAAQSGGGGPSAKASDAE